jgi:hypothetical protein
MNCGNDPHLAAASAANVTDFLQVAYRKSAGESTFRFSL